MLRAIAVDDERIALERLRRISKDVSSMEMLRCFSKPHEAIAFIEENDVDLAFLDIEMPKVNGLKLSELIFQMKPEIDIIFVTAYEKYALQAANGYASGYLLKPIEADDIQKQVDKVMKRRNARSIRETKHRLSVKCMGQFQVKSLFEQQNPIKWRTSKAEELFAFLIHHQGRPVPKELILEALWPEMDLSKANNNLHVTCHFIREALNDIGCSEILIRARGNYQLSMDYVECDFFKLAMLYDRMDYTEDDLDGLIALSKAYEGAYMQGKSYEWAQEMRTWLEAKYEQCMCRLSEAYKGSQNYLSAVDVLYKLMMDIPEADGAYRRAIDLCIEMNDYYAATQLLKRYELLLMDVYDIAPPMELYQRIEAIKRG